jgi:hypothetical protein
MHKRGALDEPPTMTAVADLISPEIPVPRELLSLCAISGA